MATRRHSQRTRPPTAVPAMEEEEERSSEEEKEKEEEEEVERDEQEDLSPSNSSSRRRSTRKTSKKIPQLPPDSETEQDETDKEEKDSDDESEASAPRPARKRRPAPSKSKKSDNNGNKKSSASHGSSLAVLGNKCLFKNETPDNSLVAAVIRSKDLSSLAAHVMEDYQANPNQVCAQLLNLLFRSVGSHPDANVDPDEVQVSELSDDECNDILSYVAEKMEYVPVSKVLLHLDPAKNKAYRDAYQEFFYQLAKAALEDKDGVSGEQIDAVTAFIGTLMVATSFGQPDLRFGATMAIHSMSKAILQCTKELNSKIETGKRQLQVAKRNKSRVKADVLAKEVADRTDRSEILSELVAETVLSSLSGKRVRDSVPHIRVHVLETLADFCLIRPDKFMVGAVIKYFGWFMYDTEAIVRCAAMQGLLSIVQARRAKAIDFDKSKLESFVMKFHGRLANLTVDESVTNQEKATELLLLLLNENFLEEIDDADMWDRTNARAVAPDTSPRVRMNALYFIIAQCEQFDDENYVDVYTEKRAIDQILALASWMASTLSKDDNPLDLIRYEYADFIIHSLMAMEEHASLTTNWSAMLKALQSNEASDGPRVDTIKQRVLMRMFVTAAELEAPDNSFHKCANFDTDLLAMEGDKRKHQVTHGAKRLGKQPLIRQHDDFNAALASALSHLLVRFKGDTHIIRELSRLPQYFSVDAFNQPNQKTNFSALIDNLSKLFLELTDKNILSNCAFTLVAFSQASHSRAGEAMLKIKAIAELLRDRMFDLITKKRQLIANHGDDKELCDVESSKAVCLLRLATLGKRCDLAELLGDGTQDSADAALRRLSNHICKDLEGDLRERIVKWESTDDSSDGSLQGPRPLIPDVWKFGDERLHDFIANSTKHGLDFLFMGMAWRLKKEIDSIEDGPGDSIVDDQLQDHILVSIRDKFVRLLLLCFEQEIDVEEYAEGTFSSVHLNFKSSVLVHAVIAVGDLELLLPKWFRDAESPVISMLAEFDDKRAMLNGCMKSFVLSKSLTEQSFIQQRNLDSQSKNGDSALMRQLLLPLARSSFVNTLQEEKEHSLATVLRCSHGCGETAMKIASDLDKAVVKLVPSLCVENHFVALQQMFSAWCKQEPDELNDLPTEAENEAHAAAINCQKERMTDIVAKAQAMVQDLSFGRARDQKLTKLLAYIVKFGIGFAFTMNKGSQAYGFLPFLRPLAKYVARLKNTAVAQDVEKTLNMKEHALRKKPWYHEMTAYDLVSISEFRKAGGFKAFSEIQHTSSSSQASEGSDVSSNSSLSPVPEGVEDDDEPDSPTGQSPPRASMTANNSDESDMDEEHAESMSASRKRTLLSNASSSKRRKSDASEASEDSSEETQPLRTLRGTHISTVDSPLSSTPISTATDSVITKTSTLVPTRRHASFGGRRKANNGSEASVLRSVRRSTMGEISALSESTIQHRESDLEGEE